MRSLVKLICLGALVACGACSRSESPTQTKPVTPLASQAAAMELGFAAGSMLSLVALPVAQRKESSAGFLHEDAVLSQLVLQLQIKGADSALAKIRSGYSNPDSIRGAESILEGLNFLKDRLAASEHPDLMHVFRLGSSVAFTTETCIIVARMNPSEQILANYIALLKQRYGLSMEDLTLAALPKDLTDAVRLTDLNNRDIRSARDLEEVISAGLTVKDLVGKLKATGTIDRAPGVAAKGGSSNGPKQGLKTAADWSTHRHPHGFAFTYPSAWSVQDDKENKSILLLPPGITLQSPGPKPVFIITATQGVSDPVAMRSYLESQIAPPGRARIISYNQTPFTEGIGPGSILSWEVFIPESNLTSGARIIVVIIKNWAVQVSVFGPKKITEIHDDTMRKIAASLTWE